MKQAKLPATIKLAEIEKTHGALTAPAVEPALTAANAGSRFVLVPAAQFGSVGIGGWIAQILKVARNKDQTTEIMFKDGDGRKQKQYFMFEHVAASFKPLS